MVGARLPAGVRPDHRRVARRAAEARSTSSASSGTAPTPTTRALDPIEFEAAIAAGSPERDFGERSDDDIYLLYTGGTTGMPKGVMWRQEDVYFALARRHRRVHATSGSTRAERGERQDRSRAAVGHRHDADPAADARRRARWARSARSSRATPRSSPTSFDAEEVWRTVERERVNIAVGHRRRDGAPAGRRARDAAGRRRPLVASCRSAARPRSSRRR